jgi:hypothetical protein
MNSLSNKDSFFVSIFPIKYNFSLIISSDPHLKMIDHEQKSAKRYYLTFEKLPLAKPHHFSLHPGSYGAQ